LDNSLRPHLQTIPRLPRYFHLPLSQSPSLTPLPVIYATPSLSHSYTYASLRQTTISFGTGLRQHFSFKKNDVLALFAQNCIDTPAVTWGAHFAGGIVSPANPAYTVRELAHHLRDSGARILVAQKHLLKPALAAAKEAGIEKGNVILISEEREGGIRHFKDVLVEGGKEGDRESIDAKRDLAYLVYSSGTTGLPKGVMLSHENAVSDLFMLNSAEGQILRWDRDRVLSVLPYYHIYGSSSLSCGIFKKQAVN
jgi:acyl-CoA synthetase (AMP-forming)/AMP-acid ligase II